MIQKVMVVTGAGGYIGGEIARTLAKDGNFVIVTDLILDTAERTAREIRESGGCAEALALDVTDSQAVNTAFASIADTYGKLDAMVHAAGGSAKVAGPDAKWEDLVNQEEHVIDAVIRVNLYGAIYTARAAARIMIEKNIPGRIVLISSVAGISGLAGRAEYSAAKGGVIALAKALAKELGKYGITVNTVSPGAVGNHTVPDDRPDMLKTNFLGRRGSAADIASGVAFMISDRSGFITGQTLQVDGGRTLATKGTD